jgi:LDH2 family malate/lactate/ureidoglycolate dehydrogenase
MPTIEHQTLRRVTQAVLEAAGTPPPAAQAVCESLVEANLMGHDSHGVLRLPQYIDLVRHKIVLPQATAGMIAQQGATAQIDGRFGWGQPAARLATQTAITLASDHGAGVATIINCNHIGRVGEYVETIARSGMIGIALCNAGPAVAPYGTYHRIMGTNPFAWAAPGGPGQPPFVLDFATSGVAEGKLRVARSKGELIPEGIVVDSNGQPSRDPAAFYDGGALQTFGMHKGSGMSVMIELLARGLCGVDQARTSNIGLNGPIIMALNIPFLAPIDQFDSAAERLRAQIAGSPPITGFEEVLLPGDPERRTRLRRLEEGIPVPQQIWSSIEALAAEWNISISD